MKAKIFIAMACALLMVFSGITSAIVITVDDSGGKDYNTIQAALNSANENDIILVYPGTYTENIDVNKSVAIISESANPEDTKVQAKNSSDHVFNVTRNNVTISGLNITDAFDPDCSGIYCAGIDNCNISNNYVTNNWYGVSLNNSNNNILYQNDASDNIDMGILLLNSSNNTLDSNTAISNYLTGVAIGISGDNYLIDNIASENILGFDLEGPKHKLINNSAYDNDYGIRMQNSIQNILIDNNASGNNLGMSISSSHDNILMNNSVNENNLDGIRLYESVNNSLNYNNVSFNSHNGIYLSNSTENVLFGNKAIGNYIGFIVSTSSNYNEFISNIASMNDHFGIQVLNSSNIILNKNNVSGNDFYGIYGYGFNKSILNKNRIADNNNQGIVIQESNDNTIYGNSICNNSAAGIEILDSDGNSIYNNYFNNTNNTQITGTSLENTWNISMTPGPNIAEGLFLGGNYWARPDGTGYSQTCTDSNNDGFCDIPYDPDANNTDFLPLNINASISVEKFTNGNDAETTMIPGIPTGDTFEWRYVITNTGNVILTNITLVDDKEGTISCPYVSLIPGNTMECRHVGIAKYGYYSNIAYVTGEYHGLLVIDSDTGEYYGYDDTNGVEIPAVPTANPLVTAAILGLFVSLLIMHKRHNS